MRDWKTAPHIAIMIRHVHPCAASIEDKDVFVIDGYVGRLFEFAVSAAVARPAETLHDIAIKVHDKNQVARRIREINALPCAIMPVGHAY